LRFLPVSRKNTKSLELESTGVIFSRISRDQGLITQGW
jgi:hypothetical protein